MEPISLPGGLSSLGHDGLEIWHSFQFQSPGRLALLLVPLLLIVLSRLHSRFTLRKVPFLPLATPLTRHRISLSLLGLGWLLLSLGLAGPSWGKSDVAGVLVGRDVVIVLDFSRSMWAQDMNLPGSPERWQAAVSGATELIHAAGARGGHRFGLIVFAARSEVLVPLTSDVVHLESVLRQLDARVPPPGIRPDSDNVGSGTRIGAAVIQAIDLHNPLFVGQQDIVLFTDGDDPADEQEWQKGINRARSAQIPVHVIGLGDPGHDSFVMKGREPWEFVDEAGIRKPVQTRLREAVTRQIALETHGVYWPSRQDPPAMAAFYQQQIANQAKRRLEERSVPTPANHATAFVLIASLCLAVGWLRT